MMNIQKAVELGAKRWTKNGYDRLYINLDMVEAACEKYNDGVVPMNRRAKGNFKMWAESRQARSRARELATTQTTSKDG